MLFRAIFAAAAAIATAAIGLASPAHADEATYLNDMHNAGMTADNGDSTLLAGGWAICQALAAVDRSIREHGGEPSSRHVDELLDEHLSHGRRAGEGAAANT